MSTVIFDTEVNSLDDPEVVELAYDLVDIEEALVSTSGLICQRFKPSRPFDAGAVAVHFITPEDVADCPPSSEADIPPSDYVIAHNVDFDCDVMKLSGVKRVCTLALCRHLWPQFKSHKLSAVYLELFGITPGTVNFIKDAQSAATDVVICTHILQRIVAEKNLGSVAELHQLSEVARIPTVMAFGKHKGLPIRQLPSDYVSWLFRQQDIDPYLIKALRSR